MKRTIRSAVLIIGLMVTMNARGAKWSASSTVTIVKQGSLGVYSYGYCQYLTDDGSPDPDVGLMVTHVIKDDGGWINAGSEDEWFPFANQYANSITADAYPPHWYYGLLSVKVYRWYFTEAVGETVGTWNSGNLYFDPEPAKCELIVFIETGGYATRSDAGGIYACGMTVQLTASPLEGYEFIGWTGDVNSPNETVSILVNRNMAVTAGFQKTATGTGGGDQAGDGAFSQCDSTTGCAEPLLINVGIGGYELSGMNEPVEFDINADGRRDRIGWTRRGSSLAFLAFDRNGDGVINDGAELFGDATPSIHGGTAANGFEALAEADANHDGMIDANDPIWRDLLLWIDANHDGVSQPGELQHVAASPVTAIELAHHWTGRVDVSGNRFGYEGHVHVGKRVRSLYDIFFVH